jgi:hypothetical protein
VTNVRRRKPRGTGFLTKYCARCPTVHHEKYLYDIVRRESELFKNSQISTHKKTLKPLKSHPTIKEQP